MSLIAYVSMTHFNVSISFGRSVIVIVQMLLLKCWLRDL